MITPEQAAEIRRLHHDTVEAWHRFYNTYNVSTGTLADYGHAARAADSAFYAYLSTLTEKPK